MIYTNKLTLAFHLYNIWVCVFFLSRPSFISIDLTRKTANIITWDIITLCTKIKLHRAGDNSVVPGNCYFSRGPKFSTQCPRQAAHNSLLTPAPGNPMLSSGLHKNVNAHTPTYMCTYVHIQKHLWKPEDSFSYYGDEFWG